jgi:hypothetical protein
VQRVHAGRRETKVRITKVIRELLELRVHADLQVIRALVDLKAQADLITKEIQE